MSREAAMDQLTRNMSVEWARFGIRVNAVAPGPVWTPLVRGAHISQTMSKTKSQLELTIDMDIKTDTVISGIKLQHCGIVWCGIIAYYNTLCITYYNSR